MKFDFAALRATMAELDTRRARFQKENRIIL